MGTYGSVLTAAFSMRDRLKASLGRILDPPEQQEDPLIGAARPSPLRVLPFVTFPRQLLRPRPHASSGDVKQAL